MTDVQQRAAAKHFAEYWKGKGYERGNTGIRRTVHQEVSMI